jgi:hypothetical protein
MSNREVVVVRELERMVSSSNEIFAIFEGKLKRFENESAYLEFMKLYIAEQEYEKWLRETYFYFTYKSMKYGFPVKNRESIISTIDTKIESALDKVKLFKEYFTILESYKKGVK